MIPRDNVSADMEQNENIINLSLLRRLKNGVFL